MEPVRTTGGSSHQILAQTWTKRGPLLITAILILICRQPHPIQILRTTNVESSLCYRVEESRSLVLPVLFKSLKQLTMMAGSQQFVVVPFAIEDERVQFLGKESSSLESPFWLAGLSGWVSREGDGLQQMERHADVLREEIPKYTSPR
jgi:hypothetical protein